MEKLEKKNLGAQNSSSNSSSSSIDAPKLPADTASRLPAHVVERIHDAAKDGLPIRYFEHARRFVMAESVVEFYWDRSPGQLLTERKPFELKANATTNAEISDHENIEEFVDQKATELIEQGFEEAENFNFIHKVHLPCFIWDLDKQEEEQEEQEVAITASRIGGNPSVLKDEPDNDRQLFVFQINLAHCPQRLQEILGKSGLFQLFVEEEEWYEENFARIIPVEKFDQLEIREQKGLEVENVQVKRAKIIGWQEHRDYPGFGATIPFLDAAEPYDYRKYQIWHDKFGGYGLHLQGGWPKHLERVLCEKCGKTHMFAHHAINLVDHTDGGDHGFEFGDGGAIQINFCPNESPLKFRFEGSC